MTSDKDHHERKLIDWQALLDALATQFDEYSTKYDNGENDIHSTIILLKVSRVNPDDQS